MKKNIIRTWSFLLLFGLSVGPRLAAAEGEPTTDEFQNPVRATILHYDNHAMEPFISRDGKLLFFNNRNDPEIDTRLHVAARLDDRTFAYLGPVQGVNTPALEGEPSMDIHGRFYFASTRALDRTLATVFSGAFDNGYVTGISMLPGDVNEVEPGWFNLPGEISADGGTLYFTDARRDPDAGWPSVMDIKIAHRTSGGFFEAPDSDHILKHVNTAESLEYAAAISPNQRTLYFTRTTFLLDGGAVPTVDLAIYIATRDDATAVFGRPKRITAIQGYVEAPTITSDGRNLYFHKWTGDRFEIFKVERAF